MITRIQSPADAILTRQAVDMVTHEGECASRARPRMFIMVAICALLAATGGVVGWVSAVAKRPPSLSQPGELEWIIPEKQQFDDIRTVAVEVVTDPGAKILSQTDGLVTSVNCQSGESWRSGTAPVSVDGNPLVALATKTPLWRDIDQSTIGHDVTALQQELARLGLQTRTDGTWDEQSWQQVTRYFGDQGVVNVGPAIPRGSIVWLPSEKTKIGECSAVVGGPVAVGTPLALTQPSISKMSASMPKDLVAGKRMISIDGVDLSIDENGSVQDVQQAEQALAKRTLNINGQDASNRQPLTGALRLVTPVEVYSVPASAVVGYGAQACVSGKEGVVPVTVIASSLGRTTVSTREEAVLADIAVQAPRSMKCG